MIGPEAPLAAGVADACAAAGIAVFGPTRAAARIETSKAFCHEVAAAAGVRMARGRRRSTGWGRRSAFAAGAGRGRPAASWSRPTAWPAGKGVTICASLVEAEAALEAIFDRGRPVAGPASRARAALVVVEERLYGREASVIALCDGRDALALPAARDHKRLLDGDRGPNTGGMGAYSPLPDLPDEAVEAIVDARPPADPGRARPARQPVPRRAVRRPDPDRRRARSCSSATPASAIRRPR